MHFGKVSHPVSNTLIIQLHNIYNEILVELEQDPCPHSSIVVNYLCFMLCLFYLDGRMCWSIRFPLACSCLVSSRVLLHCS